MSGISVEDENEVVDQKQKERILQRREEVDEWEMELYTQATLGELSQAEANQLWGYRVRAYLKSVEPLLQHGEFEESGRVYQEFPLGEVFVPPPSNLQQSERERRRAGGSGAVEVLDEGGVDPIRKRVQGLRDVIEKKELTAEWDVQVRHRTGRERRTSITGQNAIPMPYSVLEDAVRLADEWLQLVGVGVHVTPDDYESDEPL